MTLVHIGDNPLALRAIGVTQELGVPCVVPLEDVPPSDFGVVAIVPALEAGLIPRAHCH